MAKFIELTKCEKEYIRIWIKAKLIFQMERGTRDFGSKDGLTDATLINIRGGLAYFVKETPEQVLARIEGASND